MAVLLRIKEMLVSCATVIVTENTWCFNVATLNLQVIFNINQDAYNRKLVIFVQYISGGKEDFTVANQGSTLMVAN